MGRVYRDLNDAPEALHYFQKAIGVADSARHAPLLSKIYSQMGMLYDYQDVYEEAIEMHQKAYQYEIQNRDSNGIVFALRDIARAYDMMEKNDSSLLYFQRAAEWAKRTGNKFMEQATGIGPANYAWEAHILPLNYACKQL